MSQEIYNIDILKKTLEEITGKEVRFHDYQELPTESYDMTIDNKELEILLRKSFDVMLNQLAIKNAYKKILKHILKEKYNAKDGKQLDDFIRNNQKTIDKYYNKLVLEKDLLNNA